MSANAEAAAPAAATTTRLEERRARLDERRRVERVLLYAIANAAEAFVEKRPGATLHAIEATVTAWRAWHSGTGGRRRAAAGGKR